MSKLFFIGDSITTGAWDDRGGWANRLIGEIMQKTIEADFKDNAFYCMPYNLGISGNTIADILPRLENEINLRLDPNNSKETIQIIYAIGVNDSVYMVEEDRPRFSNNEFKDNLQQLIALSKKITPHIGFIGLPPVDDDLLNPIPWAPEKAYAAEHVKRYEGFIADACKQHSLSFCPMFDKWLEMSDWKDHLIDGVHPNSKGHALMERQIGAFLFNDDFEKLHS